MNLRTFAKYAIYAILSMESLSFLVHLNPWLDPYAFATISIIFLVIAYRSLGLGLLIAFSELLIGSKGGYLFASIVMGHEISIRMSFWFILMLIWSYDAGREIISKKTNPFRFPNITVWKYPMMILAGFFAISLLIAIMTKNPYGLIFADANAYLYYLIIFPVIKFIKNLDEEQKPLLLQRALCTISIVISWISIKSLLILFLFSHRLDFFNGLLYVWIRQSGVGEITQMAGGFYRVFFQSHIFLIIYLVTALFWLAWSYLRTGPKIFNGITVRLVTISLVLATATTIISMSRSNWVGLIVSLACLAVYTFWRFRIKGTLVLLASIVTLSLASYLLIITLIRFPYPRPVGGFDANDILQDRASELSEEAGVSSRWKLLPVLGEKIKEAPLLGSGFGETVTYTSDDPRVRSQNPDGLYTTYAFEWGWLETWIKLGLLGTSAYIWLIFTSLCFFFKKAKSQHADEYLAIGLAIGLVTIGAINFFSPYLNHPLGIGFILIAILAQHLVPESQKEL